MQTTFNLVSLWAKFGWRGIVIISTLCSIHLSIKIRSGPILRNYTWQLFHISEQINLQSISNWSQTYALHGDLTFWPWPWHNLKTIASLIFDMTFTLKIMSGTLLGLKTIDAINLIYVHGTSTQDGTCVMWGHFDLLSFDLHIMTFTLKILSGPLLWNHT